MHPVNAIQDVQQVQLLPHAEAEVVEQQRHRAIAVAQHQHHPAVTADAVQQQAVVVAQADADRQTVDAVRQLAMLRRPLWFLSSLLK